MDIPDHTVPSKNATNVVTVDTHSTESTRNTEGPLPSTSTQMPLDEHPLEVDVVEPAEPVIPELDSEILNILGDDPSVVKEYAKDIQADLAVRFQHLLTNGLSKEIRKELQDKYLPPGNCALIDAPTLNPEIKAAVSEAIIKRDKAIEIKQKELGCAISCIGEALTVLISKEDKDASVIKLLMDAARLLCDCQNADSTTRRNFVLYNVKKEMKDQLQKTKIDKLLFGPDLADTLKTAKMISKSVADLKPTSAVATKQAGKNKPTPSTSTQQNRNNLNWKAPPPSRRQKGTQRMKEPAPRSHPGNFSRPSRRAPPPPRNNRRY
ncbi:hypothetical protein NE865_13356 [Phthorimaea operculella]|nr:hypothetical protein NE865_13356 [Phthorimaea operculella]